VTRDESQVSVEGMLALEQVLWKHWSCLTNFGTSTGWSKMERQAKWRSRDLTPFCELFGFRVYVMGIGCRPMGLTHA
jgi:hypothetical protein